VKSNTRSSQVGASEPPATADARREQITQLLLARDTVTVHELAQRFGVSAMTVHRDLDLLETRGILRKVHGGATAQPSSLYESSLGFRLGSMTEAKRAIARRAALEVQPGSSVLLDDSTTCLEMVPFLVGIAQLTIVTNFLSVVDRVTAKKGADTHLILLGGDYDEKYHSLLGILAEQALSELHVDQSFVSVSAVDVGHGIFHQEPNQARIKRKMAESASSAILLVDSSKLGKRALHRVAGLDAFALVVIDEGARPEDVAALRASGVRVTVASSDDVEAEAEGGGRDDGGD
jgi:DeoR/GlpR family transcriptional regulator of sugar metabolism